MRTALALVLLPLLAALLISAKPADMLDKARTEIGNNHAYSADSWLQQVIDAPESTPAQVEEALYLQTMIYYGDVFGAAMVLTPVTLADQDGCRYGAEASRQLLLARRAFVAAANRYLNITAGGSKMTKLKLALPVFSEEDARKISSTLKDQATVKKMIASYDTDPVAGKGLLARANQFGMMLGFSSAVPRVKGRKFADVRARLSAGVDFDRAQYYDWLATVSVEMDAIVKEPGGPKMLDLAKRADERLVKVAPKGSELAKNAELRSRKYK
jgi:hypothetical protein